MNPIESIEARTKRENTSCCCAILHDQGEEDANMYEILLPQFGGMPVVLQPRTVIQIQIHLNPSESANLQIRIHPRRHANGGGGSTRNAFHRQMGISKLAHTIHMQIHIQKHYRYKYRYKFWYKYIHKYR